MAGTIAGRVSLRSPACPPREALAELRTRYQREYGARSSGFSRNVEAAPTKVGTSSAGGDEHVEQLLVAGDFAALAAIGPDVVAALERLAIDRGLTLPEPVYRDVLPRYSPAFAALERLRGQGGQSRSCRNPAGPASGLLSAETTTALGDFNQRRHAAEDFVAATKIHPPGRLATARLCALITTETDPVVWTRALEAIENEKSEPAARVARLALSQNAGEVRRKACEFLAAHPDAANETFLLPLLNDHEQTVVLAAIRAMGAAGKMTNIAALKNELAAPAEDVQLAAAIALARLRPGIRERATMPSGV